MVVLERLHFTWWQNTQEMFSDIEIEEKTAISVVNLGIIHIEAVVYYTEIAKDKDIASENWQWRK